ncbi:hypothetical protein DFP72DRAFT_865559 [Ephemerocybe angulata]|uniref:F-box domain-containing protein n=1 Tax=Ephemerocybe angulata TaxID=980116 RepID=A0A8H6IIJ5_9AGAR|nr:hypothetical protein DFP72DRAFT_865559 [Tulosesus angulatus]
MPSAFINDLPPEILASILEIVAGGNAWANNTTLPLLSSICSHWREVLLGHPQLWTKLYCAISNKLRNEPDPLISNLIAHLQSWYARAGNLPLELILDFTVTPRHTNSLYSYLIAQSKWRSLSFANDSAATTSSWVWLQDLIRAAGNSYDENDERPCWPGLETLIISSPRVVYEGKRPLVLPLKLIAPNLRKIELTFLYLRSPPCPVFNDMPWTSLTHFKLTGTLEVFDISFPFHVLREAPNLKDLRILFRRWYSRQPEGMCPSLAVPLCHRNLQHLALLLHCDGTIPFLQSVRLPSLRSLDLSTAAMVPPTEIGLHPLGDAIQLLVSHSKCEIQSLRLQRMPNTAAEVHGILAALPALQSVELIRAGCIWGHNRNKHNSPDEFFRILQEDGSALPVIRNFSYIGRGESTYTVQEGDTDFDLFRAFPLDWFMKKKGRC